MLNSDPVWLGGDFDGPIIFSEAASALYVAPFATSAQNDFEDADSDVHCHLLLFCQSPPHSQRLTIWPPLYWATKYPPAISCSLKASTLITSFGPGGHCPFQILFEVLEISILILIYSERTHTHLLGVLTWIENYVELFIQRDYLCCIKTEKSR